MTALASLPAWISQHSTNKARFNVDVSVGYPHALSLLQALPDTPSDLLTSDGKPGPGLTAMWLDVAYRIIQWETKLMVTLSGKDPRPQGSLMLNFRNIGDAKKVWAKKEYPVGTLDPDPKNPTGEWRKILQLSVGYWKAIRNLPVPQ
jgi:hypothetical protein